MKNVCAALADWLGSINHSSRQRVYAKPVRIQVIFESNSDAYEAQALWKRDPESFDGLCYPMGYPPHLKRPSYAGIEFEFVGPEMIVPR